MLKFIFVRPDNLVSHACIPGIANMYENKSTIGDCLVVRVNTDASDETILHTWHWTGNSFKTHEKNTNPTFIWDKELSKFREPDNYLDILKDEKLKDLSKLYASKTYADIEYEGSLWQAGGKDKLNLHLKFIELSSSTLAKEDLFWRDKDNVDHYFKTPNEYSLWLKGILSAISARGTKLLKLYTLKKKEIISLESIEEVNKYDVLANWN